jgi:hypothetical protein
VIELQRLGNWRATRFNGRKRSLRDIAVQAQGYVNERGAVFNPKSISSMLGRLP